MVLASCVLSLDEHELMSSGIGSLWAGARVRWPRLASGTSGANGACWAETGHLAGSQGAADLGQPGHLLSPRKGTRHTEQAARLCQALFPLSSGSLSPVQGALSFLVGTVQEAPGRSAQVGCGAWTVLRIDMTPTKTQWTCNLGL